MNVFSRLRNLKLFLRKCNFISFVLFYIEIYREIIGRTGLKTNNRKRDFLDAGIYNKFNYR